MSNLTIKESIESYNYALKNFWLRIEALEQELPPFLEGATKEMISGFKVLPLSFNKCFPTFCRLTVNKKVLNGSNKRLTETKWLGNKPKEIVDKYGRMNRIGQSILYGTFSVPTAVNEIEPEIGDLVTLSEWTLKEPNTQMIVYPIFWNMRKDLGYIQILNQYKSMISRFDKDVQSLFNIQMEFLAKVMSKRIHPEKNNLYVFTSSIANRIFNEEMNGETEAILYPSVKDTAKMDNIAIKPDSFIKKYRLKSVKEYIIQVNSDELKKNLVTGQTSTFDNGTIIWGD